MIERVLGAVGEIGSESLYQIFVADRFVLSQRRPSYDICRLRMGGSGNQTGNKLIHLLVLQAAATVNFLLHSINFCSFPFSNGLLSELDQREFDSQMEHGIPMLARKDK